MVVVVRSIRSTVLLTDAPGVFFIDTPKTESVFIPTVLLFSVEVVEKEKRQVQVLVSKER